MSEELEISEENCKLKIENAKLNDEIQQLKAEQVHDEKVRTNIAAEEENVLEVPFKHELNETDIKKLREKKKGEKKGMKTKSKAEVEQYPKVGQERF